MGNTATLAQPMAWVWGGAICLSNQWQMRGVFGKQTWSLQLKYNFYTINRTYLTFNILWGQCLSSLRNKRNVDYLHRQLLKSVRITLPTWLMPLSHTRISCIESLCVALPTKHVLQTLKIALAWSDLKRKKCQMGMFSFQGTQQNVGLKIWYHRSPQILAKWKEHLPIADDIFSMEIVCFQSIANRSV